MLIEQLWKGYSGRTHSLDGILCGRDAHSSKLFTVQRVFTYLSVFREEAVLVCLKWFLKAFETAIDIRDGPFASERVILSPHSWTIAGQLPNQIRSSGFQSHHPSLGQMTKRGTHRGSKILFPNHLIFFLPRPGAHKQFGGMDMSGFGTKSNLSFYVNQFNVTVG